jgi:hypothetical protein
MRAGTPRARGSSVTYARVAESAVVQSVHFAVFGCGVRVWWL